ncbi:MAG: hypothetical protein ABMA25_14920 [Ilumatobacteraceae bacterium]
MSSSRFRVSVLAAALLITAACSSTSSRSVATDGSTTSSSVVGDSTTTTAAGDVTTTASPETTAPTPAPTAAPSTAAPVTNAPATNPPNNGPQVVSATFSGPGGCPSPDVSVALPPPSVSISWVAKNADHVYVAIDNAYGVWENDLPLTGSISDLPFGCPGSHTYYVVAVKGSELDIEQKTFTVN